MTTIRGRRKLKLVLVAGRANRLWLISQRKHIAKTRRDRSPWIESRKEKEGSGLSVVGTVTDNHAAIVEACRLDQVPSCAVRQSRIEVDHRGAVIEKRERATGGRLVGPTHYPAIRVDRIGDAEAGRVRECPEHEYEFAMYSFEAWADVSGGTFQ